DSVAPLTPAAPVVVQNLNETVSVSGNAGAAEAGSTLHITFPDGSQTTTVVASDGSYGPVLSATTQISGTVTIQAFDAAGNQSPPASTVFTYTDITPPTTPATPVVVANPDGTVGISGGAGAGEPGSTITITFPDGTTGSGTVNGDGSYGPLISSTPQTTGTVSVVVTDAAGNSSPPATTPY
ncbi:Ig-like domain-containing protein, partial [Pseudomonas zeae]|uniref:Ig-like domain-containing protein n=1 Tax=Pseudomonas zeae TaxID=2745510 RepID=UPI0039DF61B8